MVVILAAGIGSRFGTSEISKCAVPLPLSSYGKETPITRLVRQFSERGQRRFTVIVGYNCSSVIKALSVFEDKGLDIRFIYNSYYKTKGCSYSVQKSLNVVGECLNLKEPLYIVEGDSVYGDPVVDSIVKFNDTCVAARSGSFITTRSVGIELIKNSDQVRNFFYDSKHQINYENLDKTNVRESMQIWKFLSLNDLFSSFKRYEHLTNNIETKEFVSQTSGVFQINDALDYGLSMRVMDVSQRKAPLDYQWVNINTKEDLESLEELTWFVGGIF